METEGAAAIRKRKLPELNEDWKAIFGEECLIQYWSDDWVHNDHRPKPINKVTNEEAVAKMKEIMVEEKYYKEGAIEI